METCSRVQRKDQSINCIKRAKAAVVYEPPSFWRGKILYWARTEDAAVRYIDRQSKLDPFGVDAGHYSIDVDSVDGRLVKTPEVPFIERGE
jgi:hypothetical protein